MANDLFDSLVAQRVPPILAAMAEEAARRPPRADVAMRTAISYLFWLGVIAVIEFVIIIGLVVALLW